VLDQKHVTFYARSSGVPLDVAERDVVLTYVLRILAESVLPELAFKGGTCLKKTYFGRTGRFSMDLDFTSLGVTVEQLRNVLGDKLRNRSHYGINFKIAEENVRAEFGAGAESYLAVVDYAHSWNASRLTLEVSYRENPLLPPQDVLISDELYFKFLEFQRFALRCLQKEELLSEKLRAAFQRIQGRDLYDLYLFSERPFDRDLVRKLVVVKCWNVREPFVPESLLDQIATERYDWTDLQRLVRKGDLPSEAALVRKVVKEYGFLKDLDSDLNKIVKDSKSHRNSRLVAEVLKAAAKQSERATP
jgi:predicted nucleotidyltransferase component of viral defense system